MMYSVSFSQAWSITSLCFAILLFFQMTDNSSKIAGKSAFQYGVIDMTVRRGYWLRRGMLKVCKMLSAAVLLPGDIEPIVARREFSSRFA